MLEYIPGKYAHRPVDAERCMFIHCIFVGFKNEFKGKYRSSSSKASSTGISRPPFLTMVLLAYSATTPMSYLIWIIVFPASFNIFIRARNLFSCPLSCPVVGSSSIIISGSMDNMEATASSASGPGSVSAGALTRCC